MNNKRNNTLILDNVPANVNINDFTNQLDEEVLDKPKQNNCKKKDNANDKGPNYPPGSLA